MNLHREACKEEPHEKGYQDIPPGTNTQAAPIRMTEEPALLHRKEAISETPSLSTGEGTLQTGQSKKAIQF